MRAPYNLDLFSVESDLKIVKIKPEDAIRRTDRIKMLSDVISKHEVMYPNIEKWFRYKVLPGIKTEERIAYIGLRNEEPFVSAVVRRGEESKFCHLHIDEGFRNQHLGDLFFAMMTLDIRHCAEEVHFTLPESLWIEKKAFFQSFGFKDVVKTDSQYRHSDEELGTGAPFRTVWKRVLEKLPMIINSLTKYHDNVFKGLLMSIKPHFVDRIEKREKVVEIRKKFNSKWKGCRVTIYSSSPMQAIHGYATIGEVIKGTPDEIWSQFDSWLGCSKKQFDEYTDTCSEVYAISFKDYEPYATPLLLDQISILLAKDLRPPQSHLSLEKNKDWTEAVSVAELLHSRFRLCASII